MYAEGKPDPNDERPPICPACGVTMGMVVDEDGTARYVCLECGFSDAVSPSWTRATSPPPSSG